MTGMSLNKLIRELKNSNKHEGIIIHQVRNRIISCRAFGREVNTDTKLSVSRKF